MARRFRPLRTWRFWAGWLILLAISLRVLYLARTSDPPQAIEEGTYKVAFVVDGDTLILEDARKIRLIGVDTPETRDRNHPTEAWGPEATKFARDLVASSQGKVRLQFDDERLDKYNRYLAYVWTGDKKLNAELSRSWLGEFTPGYRFSETIKRRFRVAEKKAKSHGAGMWSKMQSIPPN